MSSRRFTTTARPFVHGSWMLFLVVGACGDSALHQSEDGEGHSSARPTILCLGDSLTAGYDLLPEDVFTTLIQQKIDEQGLGYQVVNAGVSGDTSSGGLSRLDWLLKDEIAVLVLELGANDGLRGISPSLAESNLQSIIDRTRAKCKEVLILLCGMKAPPNMGRDYTDAFQAIFPRLASRNRVVLMPFFLEEIAADPSLNLRDGIHPNEKGHRILADNLWKHLEPLLETSD